MAGLGAGTCPVKGLVRSWPNSGFGSIRCLHLNYGQGPNMRKLAIILGWAVLALTLAAPMPAQKAPLSRLIMKDGSYQPVVKYEVKGDRVRYLSAERYEWEEVPSSLVDWVATKKWADERAKASNPDVQTADREREAERKAEAAKSPEVSPGIHLPTNGGVFLLDAFSGRPELVELDQSGSAIKKDTKGNILRAAINPLASARQSIDLPGAHAKVQAHLDQPIIYANLGDLVGADAEASNPPQTDVRPEDKYRIVRLEQKKDKRVVGNIKIALTGHVSQQQTLLPTLVEQIQDGPWYKIMPASPLPAGEYAIVEMLPDDQINLYVWDFGVNPAAPENSGAWKPSPASEPAKPAPPKLNTRPPQ